MWSPTQSSDYLMHHGVLGMKWGVRRYQNEDGTLTNAGKKRYLKEMKKDMKSHYENQVGKKVSKHLKINNNFTEGAGMKAGEAYRKGELTKKDYQNAAKARTATKKYMIDKYGESAVKALSRSGVLGRPIDDFTPKQLSSGKSKVNSIVSNTSLKVPSGALQEKPRTYNPRSGKMEDTKHKKSNVIY